MFADISVCDGEKIIDYHEPACLKNQFHFPFSKRDSRNRSPKPEDMAFNPSPLKGLMSMIKPHMVT